MAWGDTVETYLPRDLKTSHFTSEIISQIKENNGRHDVPVLSGWTVLNSSNIVYKDVGLQNYRL